MNKIPAEQERTLIIEQIFESWEEYLLYYEEALKIFNCGKRNKDILKRIIKKYFEVEFKSSIKAPRYYYPENSESIILQIPSTGIKTRTRGEKRLKLLDEHQHVIGTTEIYVRDQIAMRMKLLGVKLKNKKRAKRK